MLQYSEWKKLNVRPLKKRLKKKFDKRYEDQHPFYTKYCFSMGRAPGGSILRAVMSSTITDVMLMKALSAPNPFLDLIPKGGEGFRGSSMQVPFA